MDRILVIDDSAVQIEFLNSILKNDYEITMCQTAADGLRAAKEGGNLFSKKALRRSLPPAGGK